MNPIWKGLIRIAAAIGRWILDLAARRGGKWLGEYIDERVKVFRKRLAKAKAQWRIEFLKGRIARWTSAAKWLAKNAGNVDDKVLDAVCKLPQVQKLPEVAACEIEPARAA